jgi:hypothetical protein
MVGTDRQDSYVLDNQDKEAASEEQVLLNETEDISIYTLSKNKEEVKQNINELIEKESEKFKIHVKEFEHKVENFRNEFNQNIPNKLNSFDEPTITGSYQTLDNYYLEVEKLNKQKEENNNMEILLNLNPSQNKAIQDCSNDLISYKVMWDYVALTFNTFKNWRKLEWRKLILMILQKKLIFLRQ